MILDEQTLVLYIKKALDSSAPKGETGEERYKLLKDSERFKNILADCCENNLQKERRLLSHTYDNFMGELLYQEIIMEGTTCEETMKKLNEHMMNELMVSGFWRYFTLKVFCTLFEWNYQFNQSDYVKEDITHFEGIEYKPENGKKSVPIDQTNLLVLSHVLAVDNTDVIALGDNGRIFCTKKINAIKQWENVIQVSAGFSHFVGLKRDGSVLDTSSNIQSKVNKWQKIVSVEAGDCLTVGLNKEGKVLIANNIPHEKDEILNWKNIIDISVNGDMIVGLDKNGKVHYKYYSKESSLEWTPCNTKKTIKVLSGGSHIFAINEDGDVESTGYIGTNNHSQSEIKDFKNIVSLSTNIYHSVGVNSSGNVLVTPYKEGNNGRKYDFGPIQAESLSGLLAVAVSNKFFVALKEDGTVEGYGNINRKVKEEISGWKLFSDLSTYITNLSKQEIKRNVRTKDRQK